MTGSRATRATALWAGIALIWLASGSASLAAQPTPRASAPPRVLNVVHQKLKRGNADAYQALAASIVRAYTRANIQVFWHALQAPNDATDMLYLNLADSAEEWDQTGARLRAALAAHPEIEQLQNRLMALLSREPTTTLTTRRDEVESVSLDASFATMRALRLTTFHVPPGQEGEFVNAARIEASGAEPWLLYEANAAPTFLLVAPARSPRTARRVEVPRGLKRLRRTYTSVETRLYTVSHAMSHMR